MKVLTGLFLVSLLGLSYFQSSWAKKYEDGANQVFKAAKAKGKMKWTPQINPAFVGKDETYMKSLLGIKKDDIENNIGKSKSAKEHPQSGKIKGKGKGKRNGRKKRADPLPTDFDWRDYTRCKSFRSVPYQTCGDCWAVSTASMISDRYCLYTGEDRFFSSRHLATCVYGTNGGCDGGWPQEAMDYYIKRGLTSGGDLTTGDQPRGCTPYPNVLTNRMSCPARCDNGASLDLKFGNGAGTITSRNTDEIMRQLYSYGSVVCIMEVFEDFYSVGSGVYEYTYGESYGWHAMRCIGWGVENGWPYWLCINSWGTGWADKGYVKILRGYNHLGIEKACTYGYPREAF